MRPTFCKFNVNYIHNIFGEHVSGTFKKWIDTNYRLIKATSQVYFLKICKLNNLVPTHLTNLYKTSVLHKHYKTTQKLERVLYNTQRKILNIEIFDLHRYIHSLNRNLMYVSTNLSNILPSHIYNEIIKSYSGLFCRYRYRLSLKYRGKFLWLKHENSKMLIKKIKPVNYSVVFKNCDHNGKNNTKYILSNNMSNSDTSVTTVNIVPNKFMDHTIEPLNQTNNKWFMNLTNVTIPIDVSNLLQLGGNFSLPVDRSTKKNIIHEFIKDIENHNRYITETEKSKIRNTTIPFFHRLIHKKVSENKIDKTLISLKNSTLRFCKNNPNIMFTRADKGNVTVAINREEYINKIELMLQDENTYVTVKKNPMKNIEKNLNSTIKKWFQKDFISKRTYFSLFSSDSTLPKAYGLPKIHKKDYPFRIIVSSINTALYPLASYLQKIISNSLIHDNKQVKNSFELYNSLSGKKICNTHILASLDVISLFTNVPQNLAIESILKRWTLIELKTSIPKEDFIEAIKLILSSTFFVFNNKIYRQTFGTPMGSPLSPIIANLVLQDLEEKALQTINCDISFYYRYVDDILLSAPKDQISNIVNCFNSFHNRLQFTVELEINKSLSFLDLRLEIVNGEIVLDWFQKETFSGRFLSFYSNHPRCHKIGTIYNLIDRAVLLSHPKHQQKNLELCIKCLLDNGYPLKIIFEHINRRIKTLFTNKLSSNINNEIIPIKNNESDSENSKHFYVIPYISNISEITASLVDRSVFTVGFRCLNKLDKIIRVQKDRTEHAQKNNVVYKINCNNCEATYVGQTKRQIKTRVKEHYNNIKSDKSKHSVISEHILNFNHMFDWDDAKILDTESNYNKRLVSEMLHIKEQKNGINSQRDTEFLDDLSNYER